MRLPLEALSHHFSREAKSHIELNQVTLIVFEIERAAPFCGLRPTVHFVRTGRLTTVSTSVMEMRRAGVEQICHSTPIGVP